VPGELPRPRSFRPLGKPRGGGVKLGDAAVSYSLPLNGADISACPAAAPRFAAGSVVLAEDTTGKGSRHPPEGQLVVHIDLVWVFRANRFYEYTAQSQVLLPAD